jgi:hypothetical protein
MLIKVGANLEADIATRDELKGDVGDLLKKGSPKPRIFPLVGSNIGEFGQNTLIEMGRPPTGLIWNILTYAIFGGDDHTAVTGTAALYVDSEPNAAGMPLANLKIPNIAIPGHEFISRQTLWAHSGGSVVFNLAGLSSGTVAVNATMSIAEYHEGDITSLSTR